MLLPAATHAPAREDAASSPQSLTAAYFTMEIGLNEAIPTYAGGLGILAGDTIRAAADLGIPMVAVSLLHREGYFFQRLLPDGWQVEEPARWDPAEHMKVLAATAEVFLAGRAVRVRAWRYDVLGLGGTVPVYLLDTDIPENDAEDRQITAKLYRGDQRGRLLQEAVLGVGGVRLLRALGQREIRHYHMNEGHAALLVLELLREEAERRERSPLDAEVVRRVSRRGVFTTHTPVAAGHDRFPLPLVRETIEPALLAPLEDDDFAERVAPEGSLNMTFLGAALSRYVNGVARRHGEVSRTLFPDFEIESVTNGVHAATWVSPSFAGLFDERIPQWRSDNFELRHAHGIPPGEVRVAHRVAKRGLVSLVNSLTNAGFDAQSFTLGFARRATGYKRAELILSDLERLRHISRSVGRLQLVFAGKSHPSDHGGKEMIKRIVAAFGELGPTVSAVYLPNYDMALARTLIPGVDLWLNTPLAPLEASGTSGMKAALNGVPSLSTLDGWWLEGCIEGVTGWAIGHDEWDPADGVDMEASHNKARDAADAGSLYDKLEHVIVPMYYRESDAYLRVRCNAIAINGAYFNTQRMMLEYAARAYV
jgi:starch phosphorylase